MMKLAALVIVSSLLSVSAMANNLGPKQDVNCKDVINKVKQMQAKNAAGAGGADAASDKKDGSTKSGQ